MCRICTSERLLRENRSLMKQCWDNSIIHLTFIGRERESTQSCIFQLNSEFDALAIRPHARRTGDWDEKASAILGQNGRRLFASVPGRPDSIRKLCQFSTKWPTVGGAMLTAGRRPFWPRLADRCSKHSKNTSWQAAVGPWSTQPPAKPFFECFEHRSAILAQTGRRPAVNIAPPTVGHFVLNLPNFHPIHSSRHVCPSIFIRRRMPS
jgi:hypothetical protein